MKVMTMLFDDLHSCSDGIQIIVVRLFKVKSVSGYIFRVARQMKTQCNSVHSENI